MCALDDIHFPSTPAGDPADSGKTKDPHPAVKKILARKPRFPTDAEMVEIANMLVAEVPTG